MTESSEQIFRLIETGRVGLDLRIRVSEIEVAGGAIAHAVDRQRRRHLLIPLSDGEVAFEDRRSRGVTVEERVLLDGEREVRYLDFNCGLPELRDVFSVFCDDIISRLSAHPADPTAVCRAVLERWRELLTPVPTRVLGRQVLAGLLAELHFMETVASIDPEAATRLWTGPDRLRADFTGARVAVEVKATTSRDRILVEVHGLRQLDPGPLDEVYLYAEQMDSVPAGGDSVPDAVNRLGAAGVDPVALLGGLAATGYDVADRNAYRLVRFSVVSARLFRTEAPGFPRLIRAALADVTLADRISRVRYMIDLSDTGAVGLVHDPREAVDRLLEAAA